MMKMLIVGIVSFGLGYGGTLAASYLLAPAPITEPCGCSCCCPCKKNSTDGIGCFCLPYSDASSVCNPACTCNQEPKN